MLATILTEGDLRSILKEEREQVLLEFRALLKSTIKDNQKKLNAKEAAQFLGISLSTLYKRVKELPHKKFGKKLIFSAEELERVTI
jgi:excisionase family DNA binding protein